MSADYNSQQYSEEIEKIVAMIREAKKPSLQVMESLKTSKVTPEYLKAIEKDVVVKTILLIYAIFYLNYQYNFFEEDPTTISGLDMVSILIDKDPLCPGFFESETVKKILATHEHVLSKVAGFEAELKALGLLRGSKDKREQLKDLLEVIKLHATDTQDVYRLEKVLEGLTSLAQDPAE